MKVKDIMHRNPILCTLDTNLREVAQAMVDYDCGSIPVVEDAKTKKLAGIITDRDITCRAVAKGKNPLTLTAGECMSERVRTVTPETSLEECCRIMEDNQVRRVPVVDEEGACCGLVTQAHIAEKANEHDAAEVVKCVSQKTEAASAVGIR